jgi:hypothetical protein
MPCGKHAPTPTHQSRPGENGNRQHGQCRVHTERFPLLPLVIGAATSTQRSGACWMAGGVATSFTIAGLFIATIGFAIGLYGDLLRGISAALLLLLGLAPLSMTIEVRSGLAAGGLSGVGDRIIRRLSLTSATRQSVVGALLGLRRLDEDEDRLAAPMRCFEGELRIGLNRRGMRDASGSDACCQRNPRENGQLFHDLAPSQSG